MDNEYKRGYLDGLSDVLGMLADQPLADVVAELASAIQEERVPCGIE